ncbi:hypothetical protein C7C46_15820 [Streptomyces tateyamensis]|uniref:Uncharacterized protein n=1 Tax=Streptomyces tateyamensis TaxID=565073 RepID=A0A2V4NRD4_9ACTN|nr:hypothetical protein [Streptomyces tateyamensis]PYC78570.1 hypothetical protein C7C46_15820 [Streptomyces tateyamensis]
MASWDWANISALATAGGTLVLAGASFASIRSADRAALSAERAVLASLRPLLVGSPLEAPSQKLIWMDGHACHLTGSRGYLRIVDDNLYLAASLRNIGPGLGVIHGWWPAGPETYHQTEHADPADFRRQARDLYVAPGDTGFWHSALRDPQDPDFLALLDPVKNRTRVNVDLLYGDAEGGQRTISRFSLIPVGDEDAWICQVVRHWNVDRPDPR